MMHDGGLVIWDDDVEWMLCSVLGIYADDYVADDRDKVVMVRGAGGDGGGVGERWQFVEGLLCYLLAPSSHNIL